MKNIRADLDMISILSNASSTSSPTAKGSFYILVPSVIPLPVSYIYLIQSFSNTNQIRYHLIMNPSEYPIYRLITGIAIDRRVDLHLRLIGVKPALQVQHRFTRLHAKIST